MKKITSMFLAGTLIASAFTTAFATEEFGVMTYEEIIAPQYEDAKQYADGLIAVKKNGKWGYINEKNETVVSFDYDVAFAFNEGVALVGTYVDGFEYLKAGIVDENGKYTSVTVDLNAQDYGFFGENYEFFMSNDYLDWSSEIVVHNGYTSNVYGQFIKNGQIENPFEDWDENVVIASDGKAVHAGLFCEFAGTHNEGYFIKLSRDGMAKFILLDDNFNKITDIMSIDGGLSANISSGVNQGLLPVRVSDFFDDELKVTFWDVKKQETVLQTDYNRMWTVDSNTIGQVFGEISEATVSKDNGKTYGMIDKNGNTIVPFVYDYLLPYIQGYAVFGENGKKGLMDTNQNIVIDAKYDQLTPMNNGIAVAVIGNDAYLIDKYGNKITGSENVDTSIYFKENGGVNAPEEYVIIEKDGKYGVGQISYLPALPLESEMSSWAYEEVTKAIENKLIPASMQNMYEEDITRADFASVIVKSLEEITGNDIETYVLEKTGKKLEKSGVFSDTTSQNIYAANALGIVNGTGNGKFSPYDKIDREQAATMLTRACSVLGEDTNAGETEVSDKASISSWALDSIAYMNESGIMSGTGNNNFSPNKSYTREQSYITIYRMFNTIVNK